jgi:stearoyl-CoA desaturase (delta-9 desaturase)
MYADLRLKSLVTDQYLFTARTLKHIWRNSQPILSFDSPQHAFPHDFRNGPCAKDWDPSKWIIWTLYRFTHLVTRVRRAREVDISRAQRWMTYVRSLGKDHLPDGWEDLDDDSLFDAVSEARPKSFAPLQAQEYEEWDLTRLESFIQDQRRVILLIDGWVIDATKYLNEHVSLIAYPISSIFSH